MYSFKSNNEPNCLCQIPPFKGKKFKFQHRVWQKKKNVIGCFTFIMHCKGAFVLYSERILRSADGLSIFCDAASA